MVTDATKIDKLRHMVGFDEKKNRGYRNRFCATVGSPDWETMKSMEGEGWVTQGQTLNGNMVMFHATEKGCRKAGLSRSETSRALA